MGQCSWSTTTETFSDSPETCSSARVSRCTTNAAGALGHVSRHAADIVVLDHDLLEGMNGLELAATISASHPEVRILMFSAYLSDAGRFAGVDEVLDKMHTDRLVDTVERLAAARRA